MRPCVRCGRPASDHHHGRPENLSQGKGMGGTQHDDDAHFVMLDLCRDCHDRAHQKTSIFTFNPSAGEVTWYDIELPDIRTTRALILPLEDTDEYLATLWAEAQQAGEHAIIQQAQVAFRFRQKYSRFEGWWRRVAEIIRDHTGVSVSVGTVYERAALGTALAAWDGEPEDFINLFGVKVAATTGKAIAAGGEPEYVFETAGLYVMDNTKTRAAELLKRDFVSPGEAPSHVHEYVTMCRDCKQVYVEHL